MGVVLVVLVTGLNFDKIAEFRGSVTRKQKHLKKNSKGWGKWGWSRKNLNFNLRIFNTSRGGGRAIVYEWLKYKLLLELKIHKETKKQRNKLTLTKIYSSMVPYDPIWSCLLLYGPISNFFKNVCLCVTHETSAQILCLFNRGLVMDERVRIQKHSPLP